MYQDSHIYIYCRQIIVGSGKGKLNLIDLRRSGTVLNTYKGFAGGVTDVACSMSKPYVASVSLDRYLRIHHLETKELVKKVIYCYHIFAHVSV